MVSPTLPQSMEASPGVEPLYVRSLKIHCAPLRSGKIRQDPTRSGKIAENPLAPVTYALFTQLLITCCAVRAYQSGYPRVPSQRPSRPSRTLAGPRRLTLAHRCVARADPPAPLRGQGSPLHTLAGTEHTLAHPCPALG